MSKEIKLTRGKVAVVDDADFESLSIIQWQAQPRRDRQTWYATGSGGKKMHRVIMNAMHGQKVDHINGNGLDNRRDNLRICTQSQNCMNRKKCIGDHPYKGVRRRGYKWRAQIKVSGHAIPLGTHDTPEAAATAYDDAAVRHFGDFALTNLSRMPLPAAPSLSPSASEAAGEGRVP